jgi:hypothetical protein
MLSGPRVNVRNLGSPCREMTRNWEKVIRLPDLGYSAVTRSKVRALLMPSKHLITMQIGKCEVPTAPAEDEAQSNKPIGHECKRVEGSLWVKQQGAKCQDATLILLG